jgi:hypothetical protein
MANNISVVAGMMEITRDAAARGAATSPAASMTATKTRKHENHDLFRAFVLSWRAA